MKLYQDLSIDEPLSRDRDLEARVDAMTPEQTKKSFESAWFANPGGQFRRRILKQLERAGLMRFVKAPDDGREQMQFSDYLRIPPELQRGLELVLDLIKTVDGALDDPYDPTRTRADYASVTPNQAAVNFADWDQLDPVANAPSDPIEMQNTIASTISATGTPPAGAVAVGLSSHMKEQPRE